MLIDPRGAPLSSDEEVVRGVERAKEVITSFLAWADEQKITGDEMPELILNAYSAWLSTVSLQDCPRVIAAITTMFNQVTQETLRIKTMRARVQANLVAANGGETTQ